MIYVIKTNTVVHNAGPQGYPLLSTNVGVSPLLIVASLRIMSKQEDLYRPEKPLKKTREIDNEARISKEAEMKRTFNRNQKRITP